MTAPRKALSIRAPWWWFILHGGKDIENRDWQTDFRGEVYVHASAWWVQRDVADAWGFATDTARQQGTVLPKTPMGTLRAQGGALVGTVRIVDCVSRSRSPWFFGPYGFVLEDAKPLATPIPCKGALGFFDVSGLVP